MLNLQKLADEIDYVSSEGEGQLSACESEGEEVTGNIKPPEMKRHKTMKFVDQKMTRKSTKMNTERVS